MTDDPLLWLLRRLPAHARREVALRWASDMVATLPADPRRDRLAALVRDAWVADGDLGALHRCWCRGGALRTGHEPLLWFWARTALRYACEPVPFYTTTLAARVALCTRQVAAGLVAADDTTSYQAMLAVDQAQRRLVQDLILARSAA
jgi:hypothetical protein